MAKVLIYYFAFPHYRAEILEELENIAGSDLVLAAGTKGRASIMTITSSNLPNLLELHTVSIGPFNWQSGIYRRAVSPEFESVVLGPATTSLTTWAILLTRRLLGRRSYLWGRCGRTGERSLKRYLQEIMNRAATGLLVYGKSEKAAAVELGLDASKVDIVYNATRRNHSFLDPSLGHLAFDRMQKMAEIAATTGEVTIIYVGRLTAGKKIDVLLEAARLSREQFRNLKVQIIGGGPDQARLQERFREDYFNFLGWVYDRDELNDLIKRATLVVSPYEIGLLAIDALRVGTPVIYPEQPLNGPEIEALTPSVNALGFTAGNSTSLSAAIDKWFVLAMNIERENFLSSREAALRRWSPEHVAACIIESINY